MRMSPTACKPPQMGYDACMEFLSDILKEARQEGTSDLLRQAITEIDAEYQAEGRDLHDDRTQRLYVSEIRKRWERLRAEMKGK